MEDSQQQPSPDRVRLMHRSTNVATFLTMFVLVLGAVSAVMVPSYLDTHTAWPDAQLLLIAGFIFVVTMMMTHDISQGQIKRYRATFTQEEREFVGGLRYKFRWMSEQEYGYLGGICALMIFAFVAWFFDLHVQP